MLLKVKIRADKTGEKPPEGRPWPIAGVELSDWHDPNRELSREDLSTLELSQSFVKAHMHRGWLRVEGARRVHRPSKANPVLAGGTVDVAPEHWTAAGSVGDPLPHDFLHADFIVMDTASHGTLRFKVDQQPDKYVDSADPKEKVTLAKYKAGNTRVDAFYRLTLMEK